MVKKASNEKSKRKELVGEVVSNKMGKTVVVEVENISPHPLYKKLVKTRKKYFVHLPKDKEIEEGTRVRIRESRPVAKNKRWIFVDKE